MDIFKDTCFGCKLHDINSMCLKGNNFEMIKKCNRVSYGIIYRKDMNNLYTLSISKKYKYVFPFFPPCHNLSEIYQRKEYADKQKQMILFKFLSYGNHPKIITDYILQYLKDLKCLKK